MSLFPAFTKAGKAPEDGIYFWLIVSVLARLALEQPACDAATLLLALVPMLTIAVCTVQVSKACTSICMWVRAMYKYHTVALSVAPKRAALAQAQSQLDATLAELAAAQAKLQARLSCLCLGCVSVSVCVCLCL